jgi:5-methylcytosine-specific restriction endonuclease McrA
MNNTYDQTKYYLGTLCRRGHNWGETGKSLRYIGCRGCVDCNKEKSARYSKTETGKEVLRAALKKYKNSVNGMEKIKEWASSPNGILSRSKAQERYRNTENGAAHRKAAENKYAKTEKRKISLRRKYHARRLAIKENREFYSRADIDSVLDFFGHSCAYCGTALNLTMDHVVPLSRGGGDRIKNIVPGCFSCNSSKQESDALTWYSRKSFFSKDRWNKILAWTS